MANYANLKSDIAGVIRTNNNEEITGDILQEQLLGMVDSLGAGFQYKGVATPTTAPGTPDENVFYIASTAGTYTNFGGLSIAEGEVAILKYNGSWAKEVTGAATAAQVTQLGQKVDELDDAMNGVYYEETDITSMFSFSDNYYIGANSSKTTYGKSNSTTGDILKASGYVNISNYAGKKLRMTFAKAMTDGGGQYNAGVCFFTSQSPSAVVYGIQFPLKETPGFETYELEVTIDPTWKALRTTYLMDEQTYGEFSCKVVDEQSFGTLQEQIDGLDTEVGVAATKATLARSQGGIFLSNEVGTINANKSTFQSVFTNVGIKNGDSFMFRVSGKGSIGNFYLCKNGGTDSGSRVQSGVTLGNWYNKTANSDITSLGYIVSGTPEAYDVKIEVMCGGLSEKVGEVCQRIDKGNIYLHSSSDLSDTYENCISDLFISPDVLVGVANVICKCYSNTLYVTAFDSESTEVWRVSRVFNGDKNGRVIPLICTVGGGVVSLNQTVGFIVFSDIDTFILNTSSSINKNYLNIPVVTERLDRISFLVDLNQGNAVKANSSLGNLAATASGDLNDGDSLSVERYPYYIVKGMQLFFKADVTTFSGLRIGKGYQNQYGHWLEIDGTNIVEKSGSEGTVKSTTAHGLTISTFVSVALSVDNNGKCQVILQTVDAYFRAVLDWGFTMCGLTFVTSVGSILTNGELRAVNTDLKHPFWAFGSSYMSIANNRWPGVLKEWGYFEYFISAMPGQNSVRAMADFKRCLTFGVPKFVLWAIGGGNDPSPSVSVEYFQQVIGLCKAYGIELVMCNWPNTPGRDETTVNTWLANSGQRYLDLQKAVGNPEYEAGVDNWYPGMLGTDELHPSPLGAQAMATQVMIDCPELLQYGVDIQE